jgi:hypothetical protein
MPRKKQTAAEIGAPTTDELPTDKTPAEVRLENLKKAREANDTRNQSRVDLMNAIADANDEIRKPDMEETDGTVTFKDDSEETEARAAAEDAEAKRHLAEAKRLQAEGVPEVPVEEPAPEEPPAEPSDQKVVNGVTHYLAIVNGREKWLTLDQLRAHAQKVESADEYLSSAAEAVRNASGLALSKKDEPVRLEKDELRKLLAAQALGDEEAIERLASALSRPSEVTPDVLQQIDQRLSFRTELAALESEQREILDHPYLGRLFRTRLNELKQEAPNTSLSKAYRGIGKEIREAFPEKFTAEKTVDKLARKKTLTPPPQAAGRQAPTTDEEPEESVEDVIGQMAKARGTRAIVHKSIARN